MILFNVLANIYLLTASVNPVLAAESNTEHALEVIRNHGLETESGRIIFLNEALTPFISLADSLTREIQELSDRMTQFEEVESPSAKEEITALEQELNRKMGAMLQLVPTLQIALNIDADFHALDAILEKRSPLEPAEEALLERIEAVCTYVDSYLLSQE